MGSDVKRYHYEVTKRARGDYTEPGGPSQMVYVGPNEQDALEAAREAADEGGQIVQMYVSRKAASR